MSVQKGYVEHCDHDPARLQAECCEDNKTSAGLDSAGGSVGLILTCVIQTFPITPECWEV